MQRATEVHPIYDFYNPGTRRQKSPYFHYVYLHRTAQNLAAAVKRLHAGGYVIGDINESNILVSELALVTLVDTDSFQVRDPQLGVVHRCAVGKPEFTPPELQGQSFRDVDRTPEQDLFGLAVLIFQLLMEGTHPFEGVFQGSGDPPAIKTRILSGHFPYSSKGVPYRPKPLAPTFDILHPTLRQLFLRCFEDGYKDSKARPDARTWAIALEEAEKSLVTCSVNQQHRYGGHLRACPWCERTTRLGGRDPFPAMLKTQFKTSTQKLSKHLTPQTQPKQSIPVLPSLTPIFSQSNPAPSPTIVNQLTPTPPITSSNSLGTTTIKPHEWLVGLVASSIFIFMIVIGIWWSSPIVTHPPNKSHFQLAQQALNACRLQDAIEEANKVTSPDLQEKATLIIETANEGIEECNKYKFVEIKLDKDRTWLYNPIKEAKKEAEKIKTTCWQKKANEKIEEYNRDEELYKLAQQSLNQRRWNDAIKAANQINNSYWKNKSTQILQIANQELEARYQGLFFVLTSLVLLVLGFVLFTQVILIGCLIIVVFIIIVGVFITVISFGVGV